MNSPCITEQKSNHIAAQTNTSKQLLRCRPPHLRERCAGQSEKKKQNASDNISSSKYCISIPKEPRTTVWAERPPLSCLYCCCHGIVAYDDDQAYSVTATVFLLAYIYFCFIGIKRQDPSCWSGSLCITLCWHYIPLPWHLRNRAF